MIAALRPVKGSLRLILVRWLLSVLVAVPGVLAGQGVLAGAVGERPWFTEAPDPLPIPQLFAMMGESGALVPMMLVGVALGWIFLQLLTAAAVEIVTPGRNTNSGGKIRVWRSTIEVGGRNFLPYLRVSAVSMIFLGLGARLISLAYGRIEDRAVVEGWTLESTVIVQPALFALALLAWAGVVGVFAWWSRVVVARDGRRYVRRLLPILPRLLWRYPVSGFLIHWLLGLAFVFAGAATLVAWRQAPGVATGWTLVWLALLAVQAFAWHWRLRLLGLIWSEGRQDDLRTRPDEPWRVVRRLRERLRRKPASAAIPLSGISGSAALTGYAPPGREDINEEE